MVVVFVPTCTLSVSHAPFVNTAYSMHGFEPIAEPKVLTPAYTCLLKLFLNFSLKVTPFVCLIFVLILASVSYVQIVAVKLFPVCVTLPLIVASFGQSCLLLFSVRVGTGTAYNLFNQIV